MLAQILAFVARIFGVTNQIVNLANQIITLVTGVQSVLGEPAQQHSVDDVLLDTDTIITMLNDPTIGLAWIAGEIDAQAAGILAAIAGLPQVGDPVTLPTIPPSGYGSVSAVDIANGVWTDYVGSDLVTPWEYLKSLGSRSLFEKGYAEIYKTDDLFSFFFPPYDQFGAVSGGQPSFDWGVINPANTFLEELTLQNGAYDTGWYDGVGGMVSLHDPLGMSSLNFITNITGLEYDVITGRSSPVSSAIVPPVWPGLALVTMGSPVDIAAQITVDGPMDGVEVLITSVASNKPNVPYDTQMAYKFIGALAFVDDNGDVEPYQPLAFAQALYCPKFMTRATSVVVRADQSVVGTITPWVIA